MNSPPFVFGNIRMRTKQLYSYLALFTSAVLWGGSFVLTKYLLASYTPIGIVFFRLLFTTLLSVTICLCVFKKQFFVLKEHLKYFFVLAFFEPFLYFLFETYSLQSCDASVVSVIVATIPLFVSLVAVLFFKEYFSKLNFVGVVVSVLGIVIMILPELAVSSISFWGVLLAFGAVFSAVGYGTAIKKIPQQYNPIVVVTWQNMLGLVCFLPLFLLLHNSQEMQLQWLAFSDPINSIYIVTLAIFCSTIAFILNLVAIRNIGIARSNVFTNFIPVATAAVSFFLLGEKFSTLKILGIFVVILGIFLVQYRKK